MSDLSRMLQSLLKLHGDLSLSDLARETQIPQPTLHHIIEGKTKKPRRAALEALAQFFSISVPELTGACPSLAIPDAIKESLKITTIPLIDWGLAKNWDKDQNTISQFKKIILEKKVDKNAFALQLQDTSMEPLFQEHSVLIFDPSKEPRDRDFVLAYLRQTNLLLFNRLFIDGKNKYIKQDKNNGNADLIKLHFPDDKIIATLIEARIQF